MGIKSEPEPRHERGPHRNTAGSIGRGDVLLVEDHAARQGVTQLHEPSDASRGLGDEAHREARRKDDEAHGVLFGTHTDHRDY